MHGRGKGSPRKAPRLSADSGRCRHPLGPRRRRLISGARPRLRSWPAVPSGSSRRRGRHSPKLFAAAGLFAFCAGVAAKVARLSLTICHGGGSRPETAERGDLPPDRLRKVLARLARERVGAADRHRQRAPDTRRSIASRAVDPRRGARLVPARRPGRVDAAAHVGEQVRAAAVEARREDDANLHRHAPAVCIERAAPEMRRFRADRRPRRWRRRGLADRPAHRTIP